MKTYHISWLTGALLLALPAWAQDDAAADATQPAPPLLEIGPDDRVLGDPEAPVTIFEFASLTCPHCAAFHTDTLPELKAELIETGQANLVLRHFPLDQLALNAAAVADCVPDGQYYSFIDVLFKTQADWAQSGDPMQAVLQTAMLAGAPQASLEACLQDEAAINGVLAVRLRAQTELAIESTPTFFVGGTMIRGAQTFDVFAEAVASAAEAAAAAEPEPAAAEPEVTETPATDDAPESVTE